MENTKNPFTGNINTWKTSLTDCFNKYNFNNGRMISYSKSSYINSNRGNKVFFNACVFDINGIQVWYGDLDLTKDSKTLEKIAEETNQIFYVTPESGFRSDFNKITKKELEQSEYVVKFGNLKNTVEGERI
jgi:hypothetical protein